MTESTTIHSFVFNCCEAGRTDRRTRRMGDHAIMLSARSLPYVSRVFAGEIARNLTNRFGRMELLVADRNVDIVLCSRRVDRLGLMWLLATWNRRYVLSLLSTCLPRLCVSTFRNSLKSILRFFALNWLLLLRNTF